MEQEQQRPGPPPPAPPPPPPPHPAHHQPLHIIFRGGATSYFLRLEATIKKKNRTHWIDTKSNATRPYRKQRRPLRKRLTVDRIEQGLAREKSENLGYGMNRRFWQDSGALGHGDGIRTPSVKNLIDDSVHGSIPVLSDFAIRKTSSSFYEKVEF